MKQRLSTSLSILAAGLGGILVGAYATGLGKQAEDDTASAATYEDSSETLAGIREQLPEAADGDTARLLAMIESLTAVLDAEVAERRYLAEELETLRSDVSDILQKFGAGSNEKTREARRVSAASDLTTRMRNAGLSEEDISFIRRRLDEYEMAMLDLRDRATREGWANSSRFSQEMQNVRRQRESLREELDESSYDQYLYASGRPNRVVVGDVLMTSPAAEIGLQSGDQLLRYNGQRLFNAGDLRAATSGGTRGAPVSVQVFRNGQVIELYVPTGPLGVRLQSRRENPIGN